MLNLTRRVGESIVVNDVEFTVKKISPSRVVIGVDAPDGVRVLRGELAAQDVPPPASDKDPQ